MSKPTILSFLKHTVSTRFKTARIGSGLGFEGCKLIPLFNQLYPLRQKRILELTCWHGDNTRSMLNYGATVTVLEGRNENIRYCKDQGIQADFQQGDVRKLPEYELGRFDAILLSGILYHVEDPVKLLKDCSYLSDKLLVCTHVASERYPAGPFLMRNGYSGKIYREGSLADPLSGLQPVSFWLTPRSLQQAMNDTGWTFDLLDVGHLTQGHSFRSWIVAWGNAKSNNNYASG